MTSVNLHLPPEVLTDLTLPYDGTRDTRGILIAIEGINVAASIVTLATLKPQLAALASAIRRWRLRQPVTSTVHMTIKSPSLDVKLDLPPNVSTSHIVAALEQLYREERDRRTP
jgi:hypothetical protein